MFCKNCGQELPEGQAFCVNCGIRASRPAQETAQQAAAPPGYPIAPPPLAGAGYALARRGSMLPWVLSGVGLATVAAVVLVLVLVVFKASSSPEDVVRKCFKAAEQRNASVFLETVEPELANAIRSSLGADLQAAFDDLIFCDLEDDLKITDLRFRTEISGDSASVGLLSGTVVYTDHNGERVVDEYDPNEDGEIVYELVKVNGKWYMAASSIQNTMGFDLDLLYDYDSDYYDGDS